MMCYQGRNRISLAGTDERTFSVGLQLAHQRTMQQVLVFDKTFTSPSSQVCHASFPELRTGNARCCCRRRSDCALFRLCHGSPPVELSEHVLPGLCVQVKGLMAPSVDIVAAIEAVRGAVTGKDGSGKAEAGNVPGKGAGHDSDDDDGFEATSMIVSLRCPLSGARIETPARSGSPLHALHPIPCLQA